jgi:hypothetical protein
VAVLFDFDYFWRAMIFNPNSFVSSPSFFFTLEERVTIVRIIASYPSFSYLTHVYYMATRDRVWHSL